MADGDGGAKQEKVKKSKRRPEDSLAAKADRHQLYQISVQNPKADMQFMLKCFRQFRNRNPKVLREDFCGTALLCAEWVRGDVERVAVGVDLDEETLAWGREYNLLPLGPPAERVTLLCSDVCDTERLRELPKADLLCAFNYSACLFKTRAALLGYLKAARSGLAEGGVFFLDLYGGIEGYKKTQYSKKFDTFTYVWETSRFDAITHEAAMAIHFKFPDGSRIKNAFTYGWRVWSLPELRDALLDVGFSDVRVWFAEIDPAGEREAEYAERRAADQSDMWNAYVVALP
eukprot:tig00000741_g3835.t1